MSSWTRSDSGRRKLTDVSDFAVKLFEVGRVSLGQVAEFAGQGKIEFMDELGRLRIPLIDYDDLDAEFDVPA